MRTRKLRGKILPVCTIILGQEYLPAGSEAYAGGDGDYVLQRKSVGYAWLLCWRSQALTRMSRSQGSDSCFLAGNFEIVRNDCMGLRSVYSMTSQGSMHAPCPALYPSRATSGLRWCYRSSPTKREGLSALRANASMEVAPYQFSCNQPVQKP